MKDRVVRAIKQIEENNWVEVLRRCSEMKERYNKLMELLPETLRWSQIPARQLVFYLHHKYRLDFGVCPFYSIDDDRQYCSFDGRKNECLCVIPQVLCVFRDRDGKPKYPEFIPSLIRNLEKQFMDALRKQGAAE